MLLLTFETGPQADIYEQATEVQWPLLVDQKRHLYNWYGMYRATFWDVWGPKTAWAYGKELLSGNFPRSSSGDIHQRGGDVLIDDKGIIRFHHVAAGPADRPSVDLILKIAQGR